jgi:hypothetical protein
MRVRCSKGAAAAGEAPSAATALTSLDSRLSLQLPEGADSAAGLLVGQLPQLQRLTGSSTERLPVLAGALQGHPALQCLDLQLVRDGVVPPAWAAGQAGQQEEAPWPGQLLSSLPALQKLGLRGCFSCSDALLQDLAGCGGLSSLVLHSQLGPGISGAGLAVLAAGASSASMEELHLQVDWAALDEGQLAQLVRRGGMNRLRLFNCALWLGGSGRGVENEERQQLEKLLAQQFRDAGAAVQSVKRTLLQGLMPEWRITCEFGT